MSKGSNNCQTITDHTCVTRQMVLFNINN